MSDAGLRVWNAAGELRLDTSDETVRLTEMFYVPSRTVSHREVVSEFFPLPNFDAAHDRVFITPTAMPTLRYENNALVDFVPWLQVVTGGVEVRWYGSYWRADGPISYIASHIVVMRVTG